MCRTIRLLLILCLVLAGTVTGLCQGISASHLTCENRENPLGIDRPSPRFGWQLNSGRRNCWQSAYRILVADDSALLAGNNGNVWDSKKIVNPESIQIAYAGPALSPAKTYFWKVMVWDDRDQASPWSQPSFWQMGLIRKADWKNAQWIAYERIPDTLVNILPTDGKKDTYTGNNVLPLFRKTFPVNRQVKKATLFICGLGQFEVSMNGKKIGDHFLDPGWTKYDRQALYVPFDVTNQINTGMNAIGIGLGNGFYYIPPVAGRYRKLKVAFGFPKAICRLAIEYSDGLQENIVSDASWKTSASPVTFSSIYGGEDYDARLEQDGWDQPGFSDTAWRQALVVDGPPVLNAQMEEPVRLFDWGKPQAPSRLEHATWVYDLGQNASGIPRISVHGQRGDTITIIPAELLKKDGSANQKATGSPYYLQYILKGEGLETWQPRFTYYGFRYLEVKGAVPEGVTDSSHLPVLVAIQAFHNHNAARKIGTFSCSNTLFNQTYDLIDWAIRSNMVSLFTDCPHREKLGWLEEAHLMGNSVRYNYDVVNLFRKEVRDMMYSQTPSGLVPEIAPEYVKFDWGNGMFRDSPEWGSSSIIVPWYLYQWYGDRGVLGESYGMMKKYIGYLGKKAKGFILSEGLGDWYDLGPRPPGVSQLTPMGVTGTAIFYYDLSIMNQVAVLLNKKQDARKYARWAEKVKKAFNKRFFHPDTRQYASGSQTANAMALYMGLVDSADRQEVVDNIVKDIRNHNNSLTSGDIGYRYLLCVLHEAGRDDVIFDMNSRTDVPGYGYQIARGATALTESWQALPTASNNHFMLGHLMEWFYRAVAGIDQTAGSIAYKEVTINPQLVGDLTSARGSYESAYGIIRSEWEKKEGSFELKVSVPVNTSAIVYLPVSAGSMVLEGNVPVGRIRDIEVLGFEKGKLRVKTGSGTYDFLVK